ncbi:MAG: HD-GYP domain-containing protein, partial [Lachnospiraceae bacterium]|nr:HD-GYP domain-containing protein [Lachnospiraceae bacterium]
MKQTRIQTFISSVRTMWDNLDRSIYVGDRLRSHMLALTLVSIFTTILGLILIIFDVVTHQTSMIVASVVTFVAGAVCALCASVLKQRRIAEMIPTLFCAIVFTIYAFTGAAKGTAVLWSLLLPIGICYFVNVKYGIILSVYYSILYAIVFYSPFKELISSSYTAAFMERFPIVYCSLSIFTCMAMLQYHRTALFEIEHTDRLTEEVARQTAVAEERSRRIEQMSFQTIQTLANAIDAKDPYTKGHSSRVSQYSVMIAEALGWDKERIDDLKFAALLHDIGKIGVPDSILNNPRRLTDVEYNIIKSHSTMGGDILKNRILIKMSEDVARSHHERYDGRGYPMGLKGEEISEEARIVAIADAFDAMSSSRVYRKACDPE